MQLRQNEMNWVYTVTPALTTCQPAVKNMLLHFPHLKGSLFFKSVGAALHLLILCHKMLCQTMVSAPKEYKLLNFITFESHMWMLSPRTVGLELFCLFRTIANPPLQCVVVARTLLTVPFLSLVSSCNRSWLPQHRVCVLFNFISVPDAQHRCNTLVLRHTLERHRLLRLWRQTDVIILGSISRIAHTLEW